MLFALFFLLLTALARDAFRERRMKEYLERPKFKLSAEMKFNRDYLLKNAIKDIEDKDLSNLESNENNIQNHS